MKLMKRICPGDLALPVGPITLMSGPHNYMYNPVFSPVVVDQTNVCFVLAVISVAAEINDNDTLASAGPFIRCLLLSGKDDVVKIGWTWVDLVTAIEDL